MQIHTSLAILKQLLLSLIGGILWIIFGAVLAAAYEKLLYGMSRIGTQALSEWLLPTCLVLIILLPYCIYLKISSIKDDRFMKSNLGHTRKEYELNELLFNIGLKSVMDKNCK